MQINNFSETTLNLQIDQVLLVKDKQGKTLIEAVIQHPFIKDKSDLEELLKDTKEKLGLIENQEIKLDIRIMKSEEN
jgi:hypothetical protein